MININFSDANYINEKYKLFLNNICSLLNKSKRDELDTYRLVLNLLRNGKFSMDGTIKMDGRFSYIDSSSISSGAQVMYGVACCRHTSCLVNDILLNLGLDSSLLKVYIDNNGEWHLKKTENGYYNHEVILLKVNGKRYILDSRNNFMLEWISNGDLIELNSSYVGEEVEYQDDTIYDIGKTLKKYYTLKELGVEIVYDYD